MNPVLWLELRVRVRERKLWIVSLLFLLCLAVMSLVVILSTGRGSNQSPAEVGQALTVSTCSALMGLLLILGPLAGAGRISQEREQRTLIGLLNTPLYHWEIAFGKLIATWAFVIWLACLSVPFFAVASLWGGFDYQKTALSIFVTLAAGLTVSTLGLGMSGFLNRSLTSYLTIGGIMFFWLIAWPVLGFLIMEFWRPGTSEAREIFEVIVSYGFLYHHPVAPLIFALVGEEPGWAGDGRFVIPFALLTWGLISVGSFGLAVRGLKRSLFDRA